MVTVLDVQDTPPAFFNLPYSVVVGEDKAVVCLFVYSLSQMAYIRSQNIIIITIQIQTVYYKDNASENNRVILKCMYQYISTRIS